MSKKETPQNEEVDLGQLFKLIGNMFTNFFNFIGNIFKGLFHVLVLLLLHFYKRVLWYVGAVVLGVIIGLLMDNLKEPVYSASLYVKPNYGSVRQVYENIQELNQLASEDKDIKSLSEGLGITMEQAGSIKEFSVAPDVDESEIMLSFSNYKKQLDSVSRLETSYDRYVESTAYYTYVIHRVIVKSTDKFVFKDLAGVLAERISTNAFIEKQREAQDFLFKGEIIAIDKQIRQIDSLTNLYLEIRKNESEKESNSVSGGLLSGVESKVDLIDETDLVNKKFTLEKEKRDKIANKVLIENTVNVVSDFPATGYEDLIWYQHFKLSIPIVFLALSFITFSLLALVGFLKKQELEYNNN